MFHLSIDRFENQIAVLVTDGTPILFPKKLLPADAKAGDILTVAIEVDTEMTEKIAAETKKIQDEMKKKDPGGDIKL